MGAKNHDGLWLIILDKELSIVLKELSQGTAFAHVEARDVHLHHRRRMSKVERRDLWRRRWKLVEYPEPLLPGLWGVHSHWYGGLGGVVKGDLWRQKRGAA